MVHAVIHLLLFIVCLWTDSLSFVWFLSFRYIDVYGGDALNSYLIHCMEKFEVIEPQMIASTLDSFMKRWNEDYWFSIYLWYILTWFILCRGDFRVQFTHSQKPDVSVFEMLYNMAGTLLQKSNKLQDIKEKQTKALFVGVYRRILWSELLCTYAYIYVTTSDYEYAFKCL